MSNFAVGAFVRVNADLGGYKLEGARGVVVDVANPNRPVVAVSKHEGTLRGMSYGVFSVPREHLSLE